MAISSWSHGMVASEAASTGKARSSNTASTTTALRIANPPPVVVSSPPLAPGSHVHMHKAALRVYLDTSEPQVVRRLSHLQYVDSPDPNVRRVPAHVPGHLAALDDLPVVRRAPVA